MEQEVMFKDVIVEDIINKAANKVCSKWGNKVDVKDIKQEIYLHILKDPKHFAEYVANGDTGKYYRAAYNAGTKYVSKDVKSYDQIHYNGNGSYTRDIVTGKLREALEGCNATYSPTEQYNFTEDDYTATLNSAYIDLRSAFDRLPLRTRKVVWLKYVAGFNAAEIQANLNISSQPNVYKILWDGIDNIVRYLNSAEHRLSKR